MVSSSALILKLSPISEMASTVMFGNFLPTNHIIIFKMLIQMQI